MKCVAVKSGSSLMKQTYRIFFSLPIPCRFYAQLFAQIELALLLSLAFIVANAAPAENTVKYVRLTVR